MEGILPLWKPKGITSHDCVFKLRKIIRMKRIGHTGTLDPDVDGVLPICLGRATKVAEYITDAGKAYEAEVTLGSATTTEDASGEIIAEKEVTHTFSRKQILEVLQSFVGTIEQTPPMYSAVKVNGKRLYEYARQGIEVERPTRSVSIHSIELLDERDSFTGEAISFQFRVHCGKGTYIRTLAVMIGEALGYPAHMSALTRIESATFTQEQCLTLEEVEGRMNEATLESFLYPLEFGISYLPKYEINDTLAEKVKNGTVLEIPVLLQKEAGPIAVFHDEKVLAIYQHHPEKEGKMKPTKVLRNDSI